MTESSERDLCQRLERFLARESGAQRVAVDNLTRLAGGAVHHIWSFDAAFEGGSMPGRFGLVARIDAPGREHPEATALEYRLLKLAYESEVPVPQALFAGDDSVGTPFFIMERVDGETNPGRLVRHERYASMRRDVVRQLAEILARIHSVPLDRLPPELRRPPEGCSPAEYEIDELETRYRDLALDPHPVLELAIRWLRHETPKRCRPERPLTLVHGDFRVGNFIYNDTGIQAVLDWEVAHIGDPMEDLGWLCIRFWRFGNDGMPVGGLGTREQFAEAYERSGLSVDRDAWTFWEVLGNARWGVGTMAQARVHLDGHTRSHELAAIGRRTAETELAILELIG